MVQNVYYTETVMRWTPCFDDASVATVAAEKAITKNVRSLMKSV